MKYELHFSTVKNSATIHALGCAHGRPRTMVVSALAGDTLALAQQDPQVLDMIGREYPVTVSPCAKNQVASQVRGMGADRPNPDTDKIVTFTMPGTAAMILQIDESSFWPNLKAALAKGVDK